MKIKQLSAALFLAAACALTVRAQTAAKKIRYAYDQSGNRVGRSLELPPKTKSGQEGAAPGYLTEQLGRQTLRIYPNPTEGHFAVEVENAPAGLQGRFYLFDTGGKLLQKKEGDVSPAVEFDLSGQPAGVYILKIGLGEETSSWKIVKK